MSDWFLWSRFLLSNLFITAAAAVYHIAVGVTFVSSASIPLIGIFLLTLIHMAYRSWWLSREINSIEGNVILIQNRQDVFDSLAKKDIILAYWWATGTVRRKILLSILGLVLLPIVTLSTYIVTLETDVLIVGTVLFVWLSFLMTHLLSGKDAFVNALLRNS